MTKAQKISLVLLRVSLGWVMFYGGITKIVNPEWSATGYIAGAKSFVWFYQWLLNSDILPVVNFLNAWGLTLLGVSLIAGLFVRWSAPAGIVLMLLYYFVVFDFPYAGTSSFIVDQHIIYSLLLLFFVYSHAGRVWGLDYFLSRKRDNG